MPLNHESNTPLHDAEVVSSILNPSLDLSGDICPQDDISNEPGQEVFQATQFSRTAVSTEDDQGPAQHFEPDGPGDANLTFREVENAVHESDINWSTIFMSPQEGNFDERHGDGICVQSEPLLWPFLSPTSIFGSQDISDTRSYISGGYDPGQSWADRKSTRLNSSHSGESRMPSSA